MSHQEEPQRAGDVRAKWRNATRSSNEEHATSYAPAGQRQTTDGVRGFGSGWWSGENDQSRPAPCAPPSAEVRRATPLTSMAVNGSSSTTARRGSATGGPAPPGTARPSRATGVLRPPARPAPATPGDARRRRGEKECRLLPRRQAGFIPGGALSAAGCDGKLSRTRRRVHLPVHLAAVRALRQPGQQAQQGDFRRRCRR